jgi:hypothetical protein
VSTNGGGKGRGGPRGPRDGLSPLSLSGRPVAPLHPLGSQAYCNWVLGTGSVVPQSFPAALPADRHFSLGQNNWDTAVSTQVKSTRNTGS